MIKFITKYRVRLISLRDITDTRSATLKVHNFVNSTEPVQVRLNVIKLQFIHTSLHIMHYRAIY